MMTPRTIFKHQHPVWNICRPYTIHYPSCAYIKEGRKDTKEGREDTKEGKIIKEERKESRKKGGKPKKEGHQGRRSRKEIK
jgi:hypothetical protein